MKKSSIGRRGSADTTYQIKTHLMRNKDNRCFK